MSVEDFRNHWKNIHAPLVAKLPGMVKSSQHHVTSIPRGEYDNQDEPIDGIVETWWESQESLFKVQGTPELAGQCCRTNSISSGTRTTMSTPCSSSKPWMSFLPLFSPPAGPYCVNSPVI